MKKLSLIAICAMAVLAMTLAMGSCKKETQDNMTGSAVKPAVAFTPSHIDDMDKYLKDFKKKMQQSANAKDGATLNLEEAAWHLSSVANLDFAYVNVRYTDVRYDTLYSHVNVANGRVSVTDLNEAYTRLSGMIHDFYQSINQSEKHFRFINAAISEDGTLSVPIITTYVGDSRSWYFPDEFGYADSVCSIYFDAYETYVWNTEAIEALEYALNNQLSLSPNPQDPRENRIYYVHSHTEELYFLNHIDPYGSPFGYDSRIYNTITYQNTLGFYEMCYCLDSYLGLGVQLNTDPSREDIINWKIHTGYTLKLQSPLYIWYHIPVIEYGITVFDVPGHGFDY